MKKLRTNLGNTRGNAVVEMALVLPILILVLFGITEFGRMIQTTNILNTASREGARLASVNSSDAAVEARVNEVLLAANVTPSDVIINRDAATRTITVTVTCDFAILSRSALPLPMRGTVPLHGVTVFRSEL